MKHFLIQTLIFIFFGIAIISSQWWGERTVYIKTADIMFTRCISDESQWCLTYGQYQTVIQQLSAREECVDDKIN